VEGVLLSINNYQKTEKITLPPRGKPGKWPWQRFPLEGRIENRKKLCFPHEGNLKNGPGSVSPWREEQKIEKTMLPPRGKPRKALSDKLFTL